MPLPCVCYFRIKHTPGTHLLGLVRERRTGSVLVGRDVLRVKDGRENLAAAAATCPLTCMWETGHCVEISQRTLFWRCLFNSLSVSLCVSLSPSPPLWPCVPCQHVLFTGQFFSNLSDESYTQGLVFVLWPLCNGPCQIQSCIAQCFLYQLKLLNVEYSVPSGLKQANQLFRQHFVSCRHHVKSEFHTTLCG